MLILSGRALQPADQFPGPEYAYCPWYGYTARFDLGKDGVNERLNMHMRAFWERGKDTARLRIRPWTTPCRGAEFGYPSVRGTGLELGQARISIIMEKKMRVRVTGEGRNFTFGGPILYGPGEASQGYANVEL